MGGGCVTERELEKPERTLGLPDDHVVAGRTHELERTLGRATRLVDVTERSLDEGGGGEDRGLGVHDSPVLRDLGRLLDGSECLGRAPAAELDLGERVEHDRAPALGTRLHLPVDRGEQAPRRLEVVVPERAHAANTGRALADRDALSETALQFDGSLEKLVRRRLARAHLRIRLAAERDGELRR